MKAWRPKSWSEQARIMAHNMIESVNNGTICIEQVNRIFNNSYRHPRVILCAAKRFGQALRSNKINESLEAIKMWNEYKEQYNID